MSISRQNLSVVIVTFKSEAVIHECIKSIDKDIQVIVVENSKNFEFKDELEKIYKNVSCVLSSKNLGMGAGNNIGIRRAETDFVLILNPDVILEESTINELIIASEKTPSFAILAPISSDINYPNYKFDNNKKNIIESKFPFKVKKRANERVCFICPDCGPFVRVIVEQWSDGSNGPNRLTLIQHYNKKAIVFDTIRVGSKCKKKQHLFNFCAECGLLIPPPISKERIKRFPIFKIIFIKA